MKTTLLTLSALAMACTASAATLDAWEFNGNLNTAITGGVSGTIRPTDTTATYVNSAGLNSSFGDYTLTKNLDKALQLTGSSSGATGQRVSLGNVIFKNNISTTQSFSLSTFVCFSDFDGDDILPVFATGAKKGNGIAIGIHKKTNGSYGLAFTRQHINHETVTGLTELTVNTWHHLAMTYDYQEANKATVKWYLNGELVGTTLLTDTGMNSVGGEGSAIGSLGQDASPAYNGTLTLDSLHLYTGVENIDTMLSDAGLTKAVPEPATATLSLLALAGLAARRRRK